MEGVLPNLSGRSLGGRLEVAGRSQREREGVLRGLERGRDGKSVDRKISCNGKWGLLWFERGIVAEVVEKTTTMIV